jgi:hypothetical protein
MFSGKDQANVTGGIPGWHAIRKRVLVADPPHGSIETFLDQTA